MLSLLDVHHACMHACTLNYLDPQSLIVTVAFGRPESVP
jgi:hypothetical protein